MQADTGRTDPPSGLGHLPAIVLTSGLGLLVVSGANAMSRATISSPELVYWAGLLLIALPIFYRLTSREASTRERLGLVCLLGLSLYAVKVVRDAPLYLFSDELVHAFNAEQIVDRGELFGSNPILEVTPFYPGLEGATSALMTLTGLSSYTAGIIVVGAARLSLVAAMFLLFARISGSPRTAGIGVAIYAGSFNFLYWGAQFSYASLSLPLLLVVMMVLAEREADARRWARDWAVPLVLGIAAIVVTHHLTSYALVGLLAALVLSYWIVDRTWQWANPWRFAILAAVLSGAWLLLVAESTFDYISPVLGNAFEELFETAAGEAPARDLFRDSESAVIETPILAQGTALLAIALLAAALPFGLLRLWREHRSQPFALIFGVGAVLFFFTLALRLSPAAWETGNRASEYLFIGLAFTVACIGLEAWRLRGSRMLGRAAIAAALGVILAGGAIAGWPWGQQLSAPLKIRADGETIVSPPLAAAEWASGELPADSRFAASIADGRLLMSPGDRIALAGTSPAIEEILVNPTFAGWELPLLRDRDLRYVVTDRRELAHDAVRGYFFTNPNRPEFERLLEKEVIAKFGDLPGIERIYASGDIAIYDIEGVR